MVQRLLILVCVICLGCGDKQKRSAQRLDQSDLHALKQEFEQPSGGAVQRRSFAVAQGKPPLVFLYSGGGGVRIVDVKSASVIASGVAEPNSLVSVTEKGIRAGKQTLHPGPLAADHEFAIYLDSDAASVIQNAKGTPATTPAR